MGRVTLFLLAALVATNALTAAAVWHWRGAAPGDDERLRGRGDLVAPVGPGACVEVTYEGPTTRLYSNRLYVSAGRIDELVGWRFCRGARHGSAVWLIDVRRPTELRVLGSRGFDLERGGWRLADESVGVSAAGVGFDGLYSRSFEPGRYAVRQGFSPAAPVVFWNAEAVGLTR